jgi:hypothetical protein
MSRTTRRALLTGAGVAVTLPATARQTMPAAHPDAALIATCDAFVAWDRECSTVWARLDAMPAGPEKDAAASAGRASRAREARRYQRELDTIADMRAVTLDGLRAKARAIRQHWGGDAPDDAGAAVSLLDDLLAGGAQ